MQKSYGRLEQNKNKEIVTKNDQPASGAGFERAVLVAVIRDQQDPRQAEEYLAELEFLAETAGIVGVRRFTQRLPQPSARIYVGPGKLEEIAAYCKEEEIDVAIFDDELSPSQTRNIEAAMPCRIQSSFTLPMAITCIFSILLPPQAQSIGLGRIRGADRR